MFEIFYQRLRYWPLASPSKISVENSANGLVSKCAYYLEPKAHVWICFQDGKFKIFYRRLKYLAFEFNCQNISQKVWSTKCGFSRSWPGSEQKARAWTCFRDGTLKVSFKVFGQSLIFSSLASGFSC